jgi:hypothetical protein
MRLGGCTFGQNSAKTFSGIAVLPKSAGHEF